LKWPSGKERRKLERFDLNIPATIKVRAQPHDQERQILNFRTKNICSGGAYFPTKNPLPKNNRVKIHLTIINDRLKELTGSLGYVKVGGTVLRSESAGMAICFDKRYEILPLVKT